MVCADHKSSRGNCKKNVHQRIASKLKGLAEETAAKEEEVAEKEKESAARENKS